MLVTKIAGMSGYVSQAIWSDNECDLKLVAMTINGREMAVRGIVANFLLTRYMPVMANDGRELHLQKGYDSFSFKGGKISPEFYQAVLWNKDVKASIIKRVDFNTYIDSNFTIPFHPRWETRVWDYCLEMEWIWPLETFGVSEKYFAVQLREQTLQSIILEDFEGFKAMLKKAA
jgi:hypothetical protein